MIGQRKAIDAISRYVRLNNIRPGDKLPSIRTIAGDTGLAMGTVARAIKTLSEEGVLIAQNRSGTVLAKDICEESNNTVQRIIMLNCVSNNNISGFVTDEITSGIRRGIKSLLPKAEFSTVWFTPEDDEESLEDIIHYHYVLRGRPKNVVFLLGNAPFWIKKRFQDLQVPSIVHGGNEEGIYLPNITVDIQHAVDEIIRALDKAGAYPAVLLIDIELVIGYQGEIIECFEQAERVMSKEIKLLRMSNVLEVFRSQLMQILRSKNPPKTLIARGDESAIRAARVCYELGLLDKIGIISMHSSSLGEQFMPSLTGLCQDFNAMAESIVKFANQICQGAQLYSVCDKHEAILVFRESFKNPYVVKNG